MTTNAPPTPPAIPAVLTGPGLLDAALTGGKFARLESMRAAGLPVPPLYCLPATAFDTATRAVRAALPPPPDPADPAAVRGWSRAALSAAAGLAAEPALVAQLLTAFDQVIGPEGLAAVRACAVAGPDDPGEDAEGDPFAGMSDSFLYVPREQLAARVTDCWRSAWNPEAVLYRLRRGGDPAAARIAVGVQQMALGARSFVVFTRDPRDGGHRHLVAAAHGIGEGVVQEKADVDHFFVDRSDGTTSSQLTRKTRMMVAPTAADPGRPAIAEVPAALALAPVLDEGQLRLVTRHAELIERHFGGPQDIEGTFTPDGALHIVQSRPLVVSETASETVSKTASPAASPAATPARTVQWSNHNITESYPGVSGALTFSVAEEFYRVIFTDLYRRMGVPERRLRRADHQLHRMVGLLDGRVFYRLDAWYALHQQLPAFGIIRGWWEHGMGLAADPHPPEHSRPRTLRNLRAVPGLLTWMSQHPRAVREFLRWWDTVRADATAIDAHTPEELVVFYRRLWAEVATRWGVTLTNSVFLGAAAVGLDGLLRRWAGQQDHALLLGLLSGGPQNRSLAALRSAVALGECLAAHPAARADLLGTVPDRQLWQQLTTGHYGPGPARAAELHLARYGDRAPGDLKLEQPTPRQQPWTVLEQVRPFVRQGYSVEASVAEERQVRRQAEQELRLACPQPLRRAIVRALAALMRRFVKVREDTRFCRTELYGISRQLLLRMGTALAEAAQLDAVEDVFDLTVEEVLGAVDGTRPSGGLRELAAQRRAERERCAALPAPPSRQLTDAGALPAVPRPWAAAAAPASGAAEQVLRGLPSSRGVVRGRARVVLDPAEATEVLADRILVARETDPGWLFLMTAAKGLVVERGTLLSHTAITGRLLGVPTVVAVAGATTLIPDGAWVELDATEGTVRLLGQSPDEQP
ncbi:phosphohistidine swiveling domain-containing protein [Kitasatospora sp. MAP12-15]|uniref:PEP/pyruvate-binding domain-containing protein n=1 Tax=unclassified Kitasatospora TaxID=2633591 RepID=UPI0024739D23|nr:PEP/pyruvate-binding domain-containing protein [Kitasatospora sp. MAP12-44]MDH6108794.1 phosphohistidine swiveling domain-containing protein [Kitasatospora sp. MAP12-44]